MPVEPAKDRELQILGVFVRSLGDEQAQVVGRVIQLVDLRDFRVQSHDAVEREDGIFVAIADEQRPWAQPARPLADNPSDRCSP